MNITMKENLPEHFGIVEWFRPGEYDRVEKVLSDMKKIGARRLRTGISWADWYTTAGVTWYEWLIPRLAPEVELLPCILYTPPRSALSRKHRHLLSAPRNTPISSIFSLRVSESILNMWSSGTSRTT